MTGTPAATRSDDSLTPRVVQALVVGVGTAVVSPARLPVGVSRGLHLGMGLLGGVGGAVAAGEEVSGRRRAGLGLLLGTFMAGSSWAGFALDRAGEGWLRRRGVRRPRVVMGVVAGLVALAMPQESHEESDRRERAQETDADA